MNEFFHCCTVKRGAKSLVVSKYFDETEIVTGLQPSVTVSKISCGYLEIGMKETLMCEVGDILHLVRVNFFYFYFFTIIIVVVVCYLVC